MNVTDTAEKAIALHRKLLVIDGHLDIPVTFGKEGEAADVDGPGQFDLVKAKRGGLKAAVIALQAPLARSNPAGVTSGNAEHEARFSALSDMAQTFPDQVAFARTPQEVRAVASSGRLAVVLALQNAAPFNGSLEAIRSWGVRGVCILALTFIGNNAFADSARPYPFAGPFDNKGLSALGRQAVALMNDLGIVLDVSQLSAAALVDVLATTRSPVMATHSAPRGLINTRRNLKDGEMLAIAQGGGLVNIVAFAPYLALGSQEKADALRDLWMRYGLTDCQKMDDAIFHPATADWEDDHFWEFLHEFHVIVALDKPVAGVVEFVDAIDYAVRLIGIDHVGLSSDFNHGGGVNGWMNVGDTPNVTVELLRRGYGEEEIAKLWGGNFLRIWDDILTLADPAEKQHRRQHAG